MAYMNKERKAKVKAALDPVLKEYGMKGTLSTGAYSITLTLRQGPLDFGGNSKDINPYWYHEHYTGTPKEFLEKVVKAMKAADWYDRSDIMTDYFDTAYYFHIQVGTWYKPYVQV